jgi:hypothetical protein
MPDGPQHVTAETVMILPSSGGIGIKIAHEPPFTARPQTIAMIAAGLLIALAAALCVPLQGWASIEACHEHGGTVTVESPIRMICVPGDPDTDTPGH